MSFRPASNPRAGAPGSPSPHSPAPRSSSGDNIYPRSESPVGLIGSGRLTADGGGRMGNPSGSSRDEFRNQPGGSGFSGGRADDSGGEERIRRSNRSPALGGAGGGGGNGGSSRDPRSSLMPSGGGPRSTSAHPPSHPRQGSPSSSPRNSLHSHQFNPTGGAGFSNNNGGNASGLHHSHQQQQQQQHPHQYPSQSSSSSTPSPSSPYSQSQSPNVNDFKALNRSPPRPSPRSFPTTAPERTSSSNSITSLPPSQQQQQPPLPSDSLLPYSRDQTRSADAPSTSASGKSTTPPTPTTTSGHAPPAGGGGNSGGQSCNKCDLPMTGQFVRALGTVYHLDCFRCQDCNKVVASKFFPVDDPSGKPYPLCETDYFRRLGLLCAKCGAALRGSYITALDMKFHVEHFTCSVCPTIFGPQDSYYEHSGSVYCHFHYSTRFAVKCTGCRTAILKQFVEINRNSIDEHWHPECYMIHKFWNIKLAPSPSVKVIEAPAADLSASTSTVISSISVPSTDTTQPVESSRDATGPPSHALEADEYLAQEANETPQSLKERQRLMEEQVYRIWTVLSAFEESSAACISEMLRFVSSGQYIEGVRMAEKFVLHVETLFCAIDDLSVQFKKAGTKEISHVREARMLCKKVVNFFSLLSHTHETGARKMSITQELLSLVTGLAHYLKILIRIALTAALRLEREHGNMTAIGHFLSRLDRLARDPEASQISPMSNSGPDPSSTLTTPVRAYGYKSLTRAVGTLVGQGEATTDLCEGCRLTVEEECARFGTSLRWHLPCLRCSNCGRAASKDWNAGGTNASGSGKEVEGGQGDSVYLRDFRIEPIVTEASTSTSTSTAGGGSKFKGGKTFCSQCASAATKDGFEYVTRLEQYAFLLCVALNKLYALLKQRGVVPSSPLDNDEMAGDRSLYDAYRDSTDIKRLKSVNLDRKLSSTTARIPKRSTVIQSPSGRTVQPADASMKPPIPSRKDQPLLDTNRASTVPRSPHFNSQSPTSSSPYRGESTNDPRRPSLARATTAIKIVDEQSPSDVQSGSLPAGFREPLDADGILPADLPTTMEAEQARDHGRFQPARAGMLLSELSALEYFIVKHVAALMLTSDNSAFKDVAPLEDLLDMIDARKNTFWGKLFKGGKDKKDIKKKGVFGIPLEVLVERNGADSMHGFGPGSLRVPSFVDDVISAMKQMDMSVEGVFRKNGNIRRLKDLSEALDRDAASVNLSDENPVQLAALLKRFLRDLPDPLLTFKLFQLFIATQRVEDLEERKKIMHLVCCLMPKFHRDTMEVVFVFLKWVASFSHVDEETGSKMDLQNLATVICPNVLYSKGKDPYKDESFSAIRTLHELLEYQEEFFRVPEEFASILNDQDLFSNPSQLTSKEILARAENHVRSSKNRTATPIRGEVLHQRPDLQQAWSAPMTRTGSGTNSAARPVSFSTYAPNAANLPIMRQPIPQRPAPQAFHNSYLNTPQQQKQEYSDHSQSQSPADPSFRRDWA